MRALFLTLLLAMLGFVAYEQWTGGDPLTRVTGLFKNTHTTAVVPAAMPAPATPVAAAQSELVLSAPPRDSAEDGMKRFGPMAEFISRKLGRKVVYKHPGSWGAYQADLQSDAYDFVFDGPHFVSWRIEKQNHHVLVKLPGDFNYVGYVRKDNRRITRIEQLAGQQVCVHAPPNLGTLMLLNAFKDNVNQPAIAITEGYANIYKGVEEGKCVAGMLPKKHLAKHDKNGEHMNVIYSHAPFPQQALTAGVRISADNRKTLVEALMSPEASNALSAFRETYALSGWFVTAQDEEYKGLGEYLRLVQGFYKDNESRMVSDASQASGDMIRGH